MNQVNKVIFVNPSRDCQTTVAYQWVLPFLIFRGGNLVKITYNERSLINDWSLCSNLVPYIPSIHLLWAYIDNGKERKKALKFHLTLEHEHAIADFGHQAM